MKIYKQINIVYIFIFLIIIHFNVPSINANGFINDRAGFVKNTYTIDEYNLQTETGYSYLIKDNKRIHNIGELKIRLGIWKNVESVFGINSYKFVDSDENFDEKTGKDDPYMNFKFKLLDYKRNKIFWIPEIAIILGIQYGTGTSNLKKRVVKPDGKLIFSWPFSNQFYGSINFNYSYIIENEEKINQFSTGISIGSDISKYVSLFAELYKYYPESSLKNNTQFIKGGLIINPFKAIGFDIYIGKSIDNKFDEFYVGAGVIVR